MRQMLGILCAMGFLLLVPFASSAEDSRRSLSVELNTSSPNSEACVLTFVVSNTLGADIDQLVFETVLFTAGGQVDRLTLFDFGQVPANRPRVRQFSVAGMECSDLGQVLFNAVNVCDGTALTAAQCSAALSTSSRIGIEVLG